MAKSISTATPLKTATSHPAKNSTKLSKKKKQLWVDSDYWDKVGD